VAQPQPLPQPQAEPEPPKQLTPEQLQQEHEFLVREKEQRWNARMKEAERVIQEEGSLSSLEAWTTLANEASHLNIRLARKFIYEPLLEAFPTAVC
jgi:hypothetical protein